MHVHTRTYSQTFFRWVWNDLDLSSFFWRLNYCKCVCLLFDHRSVEMMLNASLCSTWAHPNLQIITSNLFSMCRTYTITCSHRTVAHQSLILSILSKAYLHTPRWGYCSNKKPDSSVICMFPGAWRRVPEGACWEADVRKDSKTLTDQDRAWYKGWLGQADIQTGGALLILKHTSFSNWPRLTHNVSNAWLLLLLRLSLSLLCFLC